MSTTTQQPKTVNKGKVNKGSKLENVAFSPAEVAKNEATPTARELYAKKREELKQAREALTASIMEREGVKQVTKKDGTVKIVTPSQAYVKNLTIIEELQSLTSRSLNETKRYINALSKVEDTKPSALYRFVKSVFEGLENTEKIDFRALAIELKGDDMCPTREEFINALPVKFTFSKADAFNVLEKFNKAKQLQAKIERQNKATAKK